ncbi:hypothetical protein [Pseudomonas sp.]|uniref:hypothetical protein n=1 Tax=Pseudomonas sp. TaxID=306 RepID=UPI002590F2BF|nr:hypothetical protein [Pseudomonas sp.]
MPADKCLARVSCHHEINNSPLGATVTPYVEADLAMKEHALATIGPPETKRTRYRPTDALLKFLESL